MNHRFHLRKIAFALAVLLTATTGFGRELHFMSKLKKGENVTISAIGTSLTAADCSSWVAKLGTWLNATYPKQVTMDDEGISGSASSHTSWYASDVSGIGVQLPAALKHSPDAVFIEFAINDCSTDVGISLALSKQNLQTMIDTIHSWAATNNKTVDVVIQTMSNDPLSGLRPNLAAYEQGYREVAAANNLLLIDHFPTWTKLYAADQATWLSYVPDHVHPNALGTDKIILPEIQAALTQTPEPNTKALALSALIAMTGYACHKRRQWAMERQ